MHRLTFRAWQHHTRSRMSKALWRGATAPKLQFSPRQESTSPLLPLDLLAAYDVLVRAKCPGIDWRAPAKTVEPATEVESLYREFFPD